MKFVPKFRIWLAFLAGLPAIGFGCGIDWSLPVSHFNSVNSQGFVDLWDELGEIDLGSDLKVPIHVEFQSASENTSGFLGKGWFLPLLESSIIQEDENTFKLYQPEGRYRYFWRDKNDSSLLNGQGGWKAEIRNNTITAWATCGWKLVYVKGKIFSMATGSGRTFQWEYEEGLATSIKEGGNTVLEVSRDPTNKDVISMTFADHSKIIIEKGNRPIVQVVNGQRLVGDMEKSLSSVTLQNSKTKTYEFGMDAEMNPTLLLDSKRSLKWDPETKRIKMDDEWVYNVEGVKGSDLTISRANKSKEVALWHFDQARGEETIVANGVRTVTLSFTSGKLQGKIRKIEKTVGGKTTIVKQNFYDENARLIREESSGITTKYTFTEDGAKTAQISQEDQVIGTREYDAKGHLVKSTFIKNDSQNEINVAAIIDSLHKVNLP